MWQARDPSYPLSVCSLSLSSEDLVQGQKWVQVSTKKVHAGLVSELLGEVPWWSSG